MLYLWWTWEKALKPNVKAHLVLIFSLGAVYLFRTRDLLSVYWPNKAANDRETRGEPSPSQMAPLTSDEPKAHCSWSLSDTPGQVELSWAELFVNSQSDFRIVCPANIYQVTSPLTAEPGLVSPFWRPAKKGLAPVVRSVRQDRDTWLFTSRWVGLKQWQLAQPE